MALFGKERDISMFRKVNYELLGAIISQQVGYYMIEIDESPTNVYGEALNKTYDGPLLLHCLITRGEQIWGIDDFGPNLDRNISFAFLRDDLLDFELVPMVGDIIVWNDSYYEVDGITENQLIVGKYPAYAISPGLDKFGRSMSIICATHLVPADKVQITKER